MSKLKKSETETILKVAAKAVITDGQGKVLLVREASTYDEGTNIGRYNIPGGRLNAGESYHDGLQREINEELGLKIEYLYPLHIGEWRPVIKGVPHQIIGIFSVCRAKNKKIKLSKEHDSYLWVDSKTASGIDIMYPDSSVVKMFFEKYSQGEQTMHYTWYLARILTGEPRVMEPETFDKLAYFTPVEAKKMYNELSPNAQNFINMLERIKL